MTEEYSPKVWLSENAFISIVSASVEAFPDETLGTLLGLHDTRDRRTIVQYAIVYQTARRERNEVAPNQIRAERLEKFLKKVTFLKLVGDFHSHPECSAEKRDSCWLSDDDKKSMPNGNLGFVVAVDRDQISRDWRHLRKGSLLGSVFPFSLKISAWQKTANNEVMICKIHCPFALGLGR